MAHARIQVQYARYIFCILDAKIEDIVQPILAQTVPVLYRDRHGIFLAAEQAIHLKLDFDFVARFKVPELGAFQATVRSKNVHADAITDQDTNHRVCDSLLKCRTDAQHNGFAGTESVADFPRRIQDPHVSDAAGAIPVAKTALAGDEAARDGFVQPAGARFPIRVLAIQHEADVPVDRVLGRALHHNSSVQHESGAVRQALDQAEVVRNQQDGNVLLAKLLELLHAPAGEDCIAYRQSLIHDQHLGIDMNCGGERQANVHAAGIFFDWPIDELAEFRKSLDAWKCIVQLRAR